MAQNFLTCDRDQDLLLPPSLKDWLPENHLAWFVLDAVEELDLSAFYADYREDGWGASAHDPKMMVALLIYAYSIGVRTTRQIERHCLEDVAFRVICAGQTPDHATIGRFKQRHERPIAELFGGVLELCAESGLVKVGVVAVDGTKIAASATHHQNRSYQQIAEAPAPPRAGFCTPKAVFGGREGPALGLPCASPRAPFVPRGSARGARSVCESPRAARRLWPRRRARPLGRRARPPLPGSPRRSAGSCGFGDGWRRRRSWCRRQPRRRP